MVERLLCLMSCHGRSGSLNTILSVLHFRISMCKFPFDSMSDTFRNMNHCSVFLFPLCVFNLWRKEILSKCFKSNQKLEIFIIKLLFNNWVCKHFLFSDCLWHSCKRPSTPVMNGMLFKSPRAVETCLLLLYFEIEHQSYEEWKGFTQAQP